MALLEKYEKKIEAADLPKKTKDQLFKFLTENRSPIPSSNKYLSVYSRNTCQRG